MPFITGVAVVVTVLAVIAIPPLNAADADGPVIRIDEAGFTPARLAVRKGQAVKFVNGGQEDHWPASDAHPTHELYPELDPGAPIPPGESWTFRFEQEGTWSFHDHLHPKRRGVIDVE